MTAPAPPDLLIAAVELATVLDQALQRFADEHGELVRRACEVPDSITELDMVVACTFLGHTIEIVRKAHGHQHAENVALAVLGQLEGASAKAGRPQ